MLRAIIFDCDGVFADTEPVHYRAFVKVFGDTIAVPIEADYFSKYVGLTDDAFVEALFTEAGRPLDAQRRQRLVRDKKRIYREMVAGGLPLLPGVDELIRHVAPRWPVAICSGAHRDEIVDLLRPRELLRFFDIIVSAESVPTSKPEPDGYLRACRLLSDKVSGLQAGECLAVEDSRHGVAAAKAAGMKVLAVGPMAQNWNPSPADATVTDLNQANDDVLMALFA